MKRLTYLILLVHIGYLHGQQISIDSLNVSGDGIVSFNFLVRANQSVREQYDVSVFTSKDDYQKPIDVSLPSIQPNTTYSVSFNGPDKIGEFAGPIQFKLEARASVFPVKIESVSSDVLKIGKKVEISWSDYHESGWYNIELYQEEELKKKLIGHHRGTTFETTLPKDLEKGNYELRVTPTNDPDLYSRGYRVLIKKPLNKILFLVPLAAAGGGFVLLSGGESGDGDSDRLIDPPGPPDN